MPRSLRLRLCCPPGVVEGVVAAAGLQGAEVLLQAVEEQREAVVVLFGGVAAEPSLRLRCIRATSGLISGWVSIRVWHRGAMFLCVVFRAACSTVLRVLCSPHRHHPIGSCVESFCLSPTPPLMCEGLLRTLLYWLRPSLPLALLLGSLAAATALGASAVAAACALAALMLYRIGGGGGGGGAGVPPPEAALVIVPHPVPGGMQQRQDPRGSGIGAMDGEYAVGQQWQGRAEGSSGEAAGWVEDGWWEEYGGDYDDEVQYEEEYGDAASSPEGSAADKGTCSSPEGVEEECGEESSWSPFGSCIAEEDIPDAGEEEYDALEDWEAGKEGGTLEGDGHGSEAAGLLPLGSSSSLAGVLPSVERGSSGAELVHRRGKQTDCNTLS